MSKEQVKTISDILANLGQVCAASMVVPFVVSNFASQYLVTMISGSSLALLFWSISVLLVKDIN